MDLPTLDELKALRVVDLKQKLSQEGLPQSGLKADLIARLDSHYESIRAQGHQASLVEQQSGLDMRIQQHGHQIEEQAQLEQQRLLEEQRAEQERLRLEEEERQKFVEAQRLEEQRRLQEEQARLVAQEQARVAAEQQARVEAEEQARREAEEQARRLAEEQARREAEEQARREAEEQSRRLAEEQARREAEEQARREAEEQSRRLAEEQARREAEEQARREAEEQARREAELRAQQEAQEQARKEAEEQARKVAEEQARKEAEEQARKEAEEQARKEADQRAQEAQEEARKRAEEQALKEAEEQARKETEKKEELNMLKKVEEEKLLVLKQKAIEDEKAIEEIQNRTEQTGAPNNQRTEVNESQCIRKHVTPMETDENQEKQQQKSTLNFPIVQERPATMYRPPTRTQESDDLEGDPTPAGPIQPDVEEGKSGAKGEQQSPASIPVALEAALAQAEKIDEQKNRNLREEMLPTGSKAPVKQQKSGVELSSGLAAIVESSEDTDKSAKGKRHKKKKKKRRNRPEEWARQAAEAERKKKEEEEEKDKEKVEIEYVPEKFEFEPDMDLTVYKTFAKIFDAFKISDDDANKQNKDDSKEQQLHSEEFKKVPKFLEEDDLIDQKDEEDDDEDKPKLSKRKLKKLNRLSVAELKQLVARPDVVEMHDVTARDPRLLVHLKSTRNTVPVPRHWCFKRKYLQGKRGIEKPPFALPDFIKKTGIMEMRAALQEKEDSKNLKSKMREKVRPKIGKIDIDYQKLHDAFFKWQTKPKMTIHGDLYYEGKEFEIRLKEKKPGDLSDDLRTALGMPVGPNAHKVPPPWLIAMQRYGPPPSYPNLKIPGLNAPIPDGCSFGYHAGGWGKPPVDEMGKPLYGDVFGTSDSAYNQSIPQEAIDTSLWGELESESEEEESEEEEEEEEEAEKGQEGAEGKAAPGISGLQTPVVEAGLATPSGAASVTLGQETPELLELRKKRIEQEMEGGETPSLYTVIPEKRNERIATSMMGSTHTYDVRKNTTSAAAGIDTGGVEMALNPEEVDLMDTDAMTAKAEAALRAKQASLAKEDLSDMVAEHAAKQSSKRKRQAQGGEKDRDKGAKKYKDFKF